MAVFIFHPANHADRRADGIGFVLAEGADESAARASAAAMIGAPGIDAWAPTVILDIHLANEGTAAAYDVELSFKPALPQEREGQKHLERTSVLRAGQSITSALVEAKLMIDTTYEVTIEWSAKPNGRRSRTSYPIDVSAIKGMRFINGGNPIFRISDDVKKLREQIDRIAKKQTRIQIDSFSGHDRDEERRRLRERFEEVRSEQASEKDRRSVVQSILGFAKSFLKKP